MKAGDIESLYIDRLSEDPYFEFCVKALCSNPPGQAGRVVAKLKTRAEAERFQDTFQRCFLFIDAGA